MKKYFITLCTLASFVCSAQTQSPVSISGTLGLSYEGYGLTVRPQGSTFYTARRPWNQVRFNIAPKFTFGKNFTLPFNFNFAAIPTNFSGGSGGLGALGHQSFGQFITNPMNNFSINPKYKWAELQLGTQYLNYSELSTGDIGVFGAGFDLKPKGWILKFFTGTSQQGINASTSPLVPGAYKRSNWMAQFGREKEGRYKMAFTVVKGRDKFSSVTTPLAVNPQEGVIFSLINNAYFNKGWYLELEGAHSIYTTNTNSGAPLPGGAASLKPFIKAYASTQKDYAATAAIGKKSTNFDIGFKMKYLGAGFFTMGYPYQQPDRLDLTLNTRFNAWKDKDKNYKMNVVASIGNRVNNMSGTLGSRANQFLGNLNWFTQFNNHWSLNVSYNNFGFTSSGVVSSTPSIKNVSNDIGVNPTYTWSNDKMSHLLSMSYNYSKYDETSTTNPGNITTITHNNTHTALLTYVPTYFTKKITPDFSMLYFYNQTPVINVQLFTLSCGLGVPMAKDKINMRGQLQYTLGKTGSFSSNNNLIASLNVEYAITKKLKWSTFMTTNYFKYGNELGFPLIGANYLESMVRTGLTYRFK
jgi:hypothetical protein